jgi:hypothetical protein
LDIPVFDAQKPPELFYAVGDDEDMKSFEATDELSVYLNSKNGSRVFGKLERGGLRWIRRSLLAPSLPKVIFFQN